MARHTDREYEEKLRELRDGLLLMAGRVESMIGDAIQALCSRDGQLARATISADAAVNRSELEIDDLCMVALARWQPMASDLRFITFAMKMVTDLERIGDLAVNICERALDLAALPELPNPYVDIQQMGALAQGMVRDAIDAFVNSDPAAARAVIDRDDRIDDLYTRVFQDMLDIMGSDPALVHRGLHVQSVAKWLERIGDHATNLAEQVIFMLKGKDVRHEGKLG